MRHAVLQRSAIGQRLRYLRSHGMTTLTLDRHKGRAYTYDVAQPGLNYRMDEIHAALGCAQLDKLRARTSAAAKLTRLYRKLLAGGPFEMPFADLRGREAGLSHPAGAAAARHRPPGRDGGAQGRRLAVEHPLRAVLWAFTAYSHYDAAATPVVADVARRAS